MQNSLRKTFYHGSPIANLKTIIPSNYDHPTFGKAIYFSQNPSVAECYSTHPNGAIYQVSITGNPFFTINTDVTYSELSFDSKLALHVIKKQIEYTRKFKRNDTADKIYSDLTYHVNCQNLQGKNINDLLLINGIWMIYGKVHPMLISGKQDHGVQYALLDYEKAVIICSYEKLEDIPEEAISFKGSGNI